MNIRAQASLEFLVVMSIIVVIFVIMSLIVYNWLVTSTEFKIQTQGRRIINSLADNINQITIVGDGYSQCFTMTGTIYGDEGYNVTFYGGEPTAFLTSMDITWSAPLATSNIVCLIPECEIGSDGLPSDVWVTNEEGIIYMEKCGQCEGSRICTTPVIFIHPRAQKILLNDPLKFNVSVRHMVNLNLTGFNITYNEDVIEFDGLDSIIEGDFLQCAGGTTENYSEEGEDWVYFSLWRTSAGGCSDEGVIATFSFDAIGLGRSSIDFINTTLINSSSQEIKHKIG